LSKITTIYNNLVIFMGTELSTHTRLNDPYFVENNPEMLLRKGWGIRVNDGLDTARFVCPEYTLARTFTLVIVRESPAKDSDPARRETAKLEILEDLHTLLIEAVSENTLYGVALDFKYESDGGFQEVFVNEKPYTYLASSFVVEYSQQIPGA
jgi:hypothetical protein